MHAEPTFADLAQVLFWLCVVVVILTTVANFRR